MRRAIKTVLQQLTSDDGDLKRKGVDLSMKRKVEIIGERKFIYFGEFPQNLFVNKEIEENLKHKGDGIYEIRGKNYRKYTPQNIHDKSRFGDGSSIQRGTPYYFLLEPLKWEILYEEDSRLLLFCDSIIYSMRYSDSRVHVRHINNEIVYKGNWEYSEIRHWLNNEFYQKAFSEEQRKMIVPTLNCNGKSSFVDNEYTRIQKDTIDNVFIFGFDDLVKKEYGFSTSPKTYSKRSRIVTDYGRATGAWISPDGYGWYWLRSAVNYAGRAGRCASTGTFTEKGEGTYTYKGGVVPVMYVSKDIIKDDLDNTVFVS